MRTHRHKRGLVMRNDFYCEEAKLFLHRDLVIHIAEDFPRTVLFVSSTPAGSSCETGCAAIPGQLAIEIYRVDPRRRLPELF
jgi:hypothetical protein